MLRDLYLLARVGVGDQRLAELLVVGCSTDVPGELVEEDRPFAIEGGTFAGKVWV